MLSVLKIYFFLLCGISFVASFIWKNCGDSTEPFKIVSLNVVSNQTNTLYVTGRGKLAMNITSPIQGTVLVQKKFFWGWTTIPCVNQLGSCTYDDVCQMSPYIGKPCPPEFTENKLPCTCPILQGQYDVKRFPINLNEFPHFLEEGKYKVQVTLSSNETEIMCLLIYITL